MRIQIKNLRGDQTPIEVEHDYSVQHTKQQIQAALNHPAESQKLLFKGKILEDAKTLVEYGVEDGAILVLMITKQKPPARPQLEPQPIQLPSPPQIELAHSSNQEALEADITSLTEMGFSRENSLAALRAARNNRELAVEYLMSGGIPENSDSSDEEFAEQGPETGVFNSLQSNPQFENIRNRILQNPGELNNFLANLEETNPDLLALIDNNMEEFLGLLRVQERHEEVELNDQEQADVRELMELGFSEEDALEAYLGCGKNKGEAASLLFEGFRHNSQGLR